MNLRGIPLPTVRRLPFYLRLFKEEATQGSLWLSSDVIGERLGLGAIQVRKDLALVGAEGRARCGFPVGATAEILTSFLGGDDYADIFLIGSGALAEAVIANNTVRLHGFKILAVFDPDPFRVGVSILGHEILPINKLPDLTRRMSVRLAVFALSNPEGAETVMQNLGSSTLQGVFDLSGLELPFPPGITVEREDFGSRLAKLAGLLSATRKR
jgi:redox-sensing transcriptional repressor